MISKILKLLASFFRKNSNASTDKNANVAVPKIKKTKLRKKAKQVISRDLASDYAAKRHECFQRSQEAFKEGNKERAFTLSQEGKEWGKKMEEMNALVVQNILEPQESDRTGIIDLHGLFVKEAEVAVRDFLNFHLKNQKKNYLEIITGAGNNSKVKNQPVIRPAIEKILKQHNLKYELLHGDGAFLVTLNEKGLSQAE